MDGEKEEAPEKHPGGRPTKYKPEYVEQAYKLCLLGFTDEELAKFFEVEPETIDNWKKAHTEFFRSVNAGKEIADAEVAQSFHKRAVGYKYDEVTYERIETEIDGVSDKEDDIKHEIYKKKVVTKELPPDAGAALNWLKNRQKKKWRDKIETGFTDGEGNDANPVTIFQLPDNGRSKDNSTPEGLPGEST